MTTRFSRRTALKVAAGAAAVSSTFHAPAVFARNQTPTGDLINVSWATWVTGPVDENNLVRDTIRERFNIDLQILAFERATWQDQLNTRVGGGDVPDIIYRDSPGVLAEYVEQGVLREVPYDAIKSAAPTTFAATNEFTTDVWLATYGKADQKNYGLPFLQPNQTRPFTNGWRQDWLDKVGVTTIPATVDEHTDAFTKFVTDFPSEAGFNYGLSLTGKAGLAANMSWLSLAWGTTPQMWMQQEDGSLVHGAVLEGTRDSLAKLSEWNSASILDPEFITADGAAVTQKWVNGGVGYIPTTWYRLVPGGEHYDGLKAVNPEATISLAPAPTGPNGQFGYMNWGPITSSLTFSNNVDDTKLERLLGMLEAIQSDEDLAILLRYGREGEHWQRDPETNAIVPTADFVNPANRGSLGTNFFAAALPNPNIQASVARKDETELYRYANAGNVTNFLPYAEFLVPSDTIAQAPDLSLTRDKWLVDFASGAQSTDNWDQYVTEWNDAGGSIMTEAVNGTYAQLVEVRDTIAATVSQ